MDKYVRFTSVVAVLLILLMPVVCVYSVFANPIPIYLDPEPVISGQINYTSPMVEWVLIVFVLDFFIDILIVYAGIYVLDKSNLIQNRDVLDFSKISFFSAVGVISIVGLLSELVFGSWAGGLIIALIIIYFSFVFVSKYILKINWKNSYRMGFFALIVNIVVWIVIFSI